MTLTYSVCVVLEYRIVLYDSKLVKNIVYLFPFRLLYYYYHNINEQNCTNILTN